MSDYSSTSLVLEAAYPRAKRHSTVRLTDRLRLAVTRYRPIKPQDDGLTLVFLHCTGSIKETWEEVIKYIFEHSDEIPIREAIAFDWVGHGESAVLNKGKLGYEVSWSDGARDLLAVIDQLKLQQPIVPIGHSMGGGQVLVACALRPRLFAACVAIEPTIYPFPLDSPIISHIAQIISLPDEFATIEEGAKFLEMTSKWFDKAVFRRLVEAGFYHPYGDERVALKSSTLQQAILFNSPDSLQEGFAMLPFVQTPVLMCIAENGKWNPDEAPEAIAKSLKSVETVVIPKARHLVVQMLPRETASAITPYLLKAWRASRAELDSEHRKTEEQLRKENNAGFDFCLKLLKEHADAQKGKRTRSSRI